MRHKEYAHNSLEILAQRAKWDDIDHCLAWGKRFIGMVGKAFSNSVFIYEDETFYTDTNVSSVITQLRRLTHQAKIVIDPAFAELDAQKMHLDAEMNATRNS